MYTGPHLIKDNLVFGYDTGYGVADNNTSTRFYPGEPTVNSLASTAFGYSGITLGSDSGGTYLETNSGTTGYNYIKVPNITVSSNETYTWSFELKSTETITQSGNKYYFDTNEYSNEFSTSNDQSRVSSSEVRPSSLPANEWVKFALTVTMKPNLTGAYSYDFLNFIKPHFTSKKIYYRNMQFEHNKSHHTPFVDGTRSSTASLIDLTRTTDIDVSNVSFDSTGQPTFDGTDDSLTIPGSTNISSDTKTVEIAFKMNGSYSNFSPLAVYANGSSATNRIWLGIQNSKFRMHGWGTDDPEGTTVISADTWYVCTFSYNKSTQAMKMYTNGVLESSITNSQGGVTASSSLNWYIGTVPGGWQSVTYSNIEVPIFKLYNRILSDQEVQQNFNAYKNRFGI